MPLSTSAMTDPQSQSQPSEKQLGRRRFLKTSATTVAAAVLGAPPLAAQLSSSGMTARKSGRIVAENAKPGDDWQLTRVRMDRVNSRMGFRSTWIEGYCSHQSIEAGETLQVMVSTDPVRS